MAFSDPLVLTLDGVAKNLVRIDTGKYTSEYSLVETTQSFRATIRNLDLKVEADGRKRTRHLVQVVWTVFATATTPEILRKATMNIEHYSNDDITKVDDVPIAIGAMMTAANLVKLNNFES